MPNVSIIVPIYNSEQYIRKCIDSVLSQAYTDFELILVDDGSTDNSKKIIDEYANRDRRIRVIYKENGRPGSARNAGLDVASGTYIYFLDSDDMMHPNLLTTVIPRIETGYDMIAFSFDINADKRSIKLSPTNTPIEEQEIILDTDEKRYEFIIGPFRAKKIRWEVWNRIFCRNIIEKWHIRFSEDCRVRAEDMYFTYFYMTHCKKILWIPNKLCTYFIHEGSESSKYNQHLMIMSSNIMAEKMYEHVRLCEDCNYIYKHFLPLYFVLHKGALVRLCKHQWLTGLSMHDAREILKRNVLNYQIFSKRMIDMFATPIIANTYKTKSIRKFTEYLYTAEILNIPQSLFRTLERKILLPFLCLAFRFKNRKNLLSAQSVRKW